MKPKPMDPITPTPREALKRIEQKTNTDCLRCCLSMVTGIPYDGVPDFVPDGIRWTEACEDWLESNGFGLICFEQPPEFVPPWLPVIAQGPTEASEQHHCVVVMPDAVIDPHPSQAGLKHVELVFAVVQNTRALAQSDPGEVERLTEQVENWKTTALSANEEREQCHRTIAQLHYERDQLRADLERLQEENERLRKPFDNVLNLLDENTQFRARIAELEAITTQTVQYQSAVSGLWYQKPEAAGAVSAVKIGGKVVQLESSTPPASTGWVSVEERLPEKDWTYCLVATHSKHVFYALFRDSEFWMNGTERFTSELCHWQPLPAAPGATPSSERTDGERRYYLMENREGRRWVGNSAVWWGLNNAGYTCNLDQAGTYTEEQVAEHRKRPDMIVIVPVDVARSVQHTHADHNAVKDALRAAMQAEGGEG